MVALARDSRLVTLTGPGGSGKTRLSIEAASELLGDFKAGTFWVGLATMHDAAGVLPAVAQTIGGDGDLATIVGERELLLVSTTRTGDRRRGGSGLAGGACPTCICS